MTQLHRKGPFLKIHNEVFKGKLSRGLQFTRKYLRKKNELKIKD